MTSGRRGSFAWLVGGTGQYIWSLLENWTVPEVAARRGPAGGTRRDRRSQGPDALHDRLRAVDPVSAGRIDARNVRRVVRAIEVFEHTGTPISTWQTRGKPDFEYLLYRHRRRASRTPRAHRTARRCHARRRLRRRGAGAARERRPRATCRRCRPSATARSRRHLTGDMTLDEARRAHHLRDAPARPPPAPVVPPR